MQDSQNLVKTLWNLRIPLAPLPTAPHLFLSSVILPLQLFKVSFSKSQIRCWSVGSKVQLNLESFNGPLITHPRSCNTRVHQYTMSQTWMAPTNCSQLPTQFPDATFPTFISEKSFGQECYARSQVSLCVVLYVILPHVVVFKSSFYVSGYSAVHPFRRWRVILRAKITCTHLALTMWHLPLQRLGLDSEPRLSHSPSTSSSWLHLQIMDPRAGGGASASGGASGGVPNILIWYSG